MHKNWQLKIPLWLFIRIFMVTAHNLFLDSNFPNSYLLPIRGYPWYKNEINKLKRGYYSSNNSQDSNKEKLLKKTSKNKKKAKHGYTKFRRNTIYR